MKIDECVDYLLKNVMTGFEDKSFKNYIENKLAGDFAYNLANYLREKEIKDLKAQKEWLIAEIKQAEPYDDEELCLYSEKIILNWIDVAFENKIYDLEMLSNKSRNKVV